MSKTIAIKEGGLAIQLTVDKLKTNLIEAGTQNWIPEDGVSVGKITITEDGTYKASDDGYYGYEEVTVSGCGTVTGKGDDDKTYDVTVDENGNIVETLAPTKIRITTYPSPLVYNNGDAINFSQMVVRAYDDDDNLWENDRYTDGIIPANELILPVTTASTESSDKTASSDLFCGIVQPFNFASTVNIIRTRARVGRYNEYQRTSVISCDAVAVGYNGGTGCFAIMASANNNGYDFTDKYHYTSSADNKPDDYETHTHYNFTKSYTHDNKTVHYSTASIGSSGAGNAIESLSLVTSILIDSMNSYAGKIAWTMIYGIVEDESEQEIPVEWERPSDGERLKTSFIIHVN